MRLQEFIPNVGVHFDKLRALYQGMAAGYQQAAGQYQFSCMDCPDNCCRTRFYNHTYIEYFFLMEGVAGLEPGMQEELKVKAVAACEEIAEIEGRGETPRVMCPVNVDGLCTLYDHRLMICRLHGIPYDLQMPGRAPERGEPCNEFASRAVIEPYVPFDRTPFYRSLAGLEQALRGEIGQFSKIKRTIAEMIAYDLDGKPLRAS